MDDNIWRVIGLAIKNITYWHWWIHQEKSFINLLYSKLSFNDLIEELVVADNVPKKASENPESMDKEE